MPDEDDDLFDAVAAARDAAAAASAPDAGPIAQLHAQQKLDALGREGDQ